MKFPQIAMIALLATSTFFASVVTKADTITLAVNYSTNAALRTQSFGVPSNVVARITYSVLENATLSLSFPAVTNSFVIGNSSSFGNYPPVFVGPATITLTALYAPSTSMCTIETTSASSFTPSSSVVIPNDSGGPVTIILESSTDLINWIAANPGTYGTTSSNRFFRVRAER
jgi:hypothetical protein